MNGSSLRRIAIESDRFPLLVCRTHNGNTPTLKVLNGRAEVLPTVAWTRPQSRYGPFNHDRSWNCLTLGPE